ncbi:MAG: extracellular solute-binding protein [Acidimicrobiia bacterium]
MRSRFTILVGLVLALTLVAAACSSDDTGDESTTTTEATTTTTEASTTTTEAATTTTTEAMEAIELVIWADEKRSPILESLAPKVLEETNVQLVIEPTVYDDLRGQVTTAAPAGEGPDIFIGGHDWVGEMAASGIAAPIDLGGRDSEWFPVALEAFNYNGQLYGMPYQSEAVALFYNTDLVPEPPTTLAELTAICDELTDIDNCWAVPGGGDGADAYHNYPFVSALGGYIFAFDAQTGYDTTDVGLDSDGAIEGVTVLEQLVADGYVKSVNGGDAQKQFEDGRAPFFLSGPWQLAGFNEKELPYAVAKLPTIDGQPMRPFLGAGGMFINQFSENTALAQAFLLDYIANEETMTALYEADPRNPVYVATFDAVAADNEIAGVFALSGADGSPMPNIPQMSGVWGPLGDQILLLRNQEIDATTAMTNAAEQVREAVAG